MTQASQEPASGDVRALTEEEFASWRREQGARIVFSRGRYWANHRGFFRLLHFAATMPADVLGRPSGTCWAYHALLPEGDAHRANSGYPLHLVRDLAAFEQGMLDSGARKQLRRARASLRLIRVSDPDILRAQGWDVFSQNARRLKLETRVTRKQYLAGVNSLVTDTRRLILAAMDGDKLLGYLETFAVADTAYLDTIRLSDESLNRHVSGFLHFEASQLYRESGVVTQACAGPARPERLGISEFKRRWGMPIVIMPARFWSPAPFRALLRVTRPGAYYRSAALPPPGTPQEGAAAERLP